MNGMCRRLGDSLIASTYWPLCGRSGYPSWACTLSLSRKTILYSCSRLDSQRATIALGNRVVAEAFLHVLDQMKLDSEEARI